MPTDADLPQVTIVTGNTKAPLGPIIYWESTTEGFEFAVNAENNGLVMLRFALSIEKLKELVADMNESITEKENAGLQ